GVQEVAGSNPAGPRGSDVLSLCFTFTFCEAARLVAAMWGRARTSLNVFGGTIWAIPKPPVMACRGLWSTVKAFLVAEAAKRERYYKSGLGRDELECLGLWCGR